MPGRADVDELHVVCRLDSPDRLVIIAGVYFSSSAAGAEPARHHSCAGRHFSLDVTTLFEVPRKNR